MLGRISRGCVAAAAASSLVAGCAHQPPPDIAASNDHRAVDVAAERPALHRLSDICADRDVVCILAGLAILGGTIAALKSND